MIGVSPIETPDISADILGSQFKEVSPLNLSGGGGTVAVLNIASCDRDADLETEIEMCQSASETPVTIYAGTSKTTDTFLEYKFANSSMAYWVTKCPAGHDNIPIPECKVLDMIQPDGPSCYRCGKPLNVRTGRSRE